jgi:hypothetical protein
MERLRQSSRSRRALGVKSVGWAVGSGNVAPTAGLEQVGRQQAANRGRLLSKTACHKAAIGKPEVKWAIPRSGRSRDSVTEISEEH